MEAKKGILMKTRAAVLWEVPGKWQVQEVDLDDPGPTEVLVEMAASGLCHSDDHFATADITVPVLPFVAGHEGSAIVRAVGADVRDVNVGDHVVTSFIPACGKCRWCASGMQNLCDDILLVVDGTQPAGGYRMRSGATDVGTFFALGTFAEWQVFDEASIVKIDPEIPLDVACLVACGVHTGFGSAINAAQVQPGDVVLIIGAGGVGMNAVQGAALAGAAHVVVVDPAPSKRAYAPMFGATEVFADFDEADAFVKSITNGQGADSAIVAIGVVRNEHIGRALTAIRKAGTVVVTGVGSDTEEGTVPSFNALHIAMFQKRIQGVLYGMSSPREAMPRLLRYYQDGKLKLDELITKRYTLDEVNQGYDDLRAGVNTRGIIEFSGLKG
jgi:S-(hydroxymethyl)glutathione dehydrogenase/alcohol dehydrogenase